MNIKSKIVAAVALHMAAWLAMLITLTGVVFFASGVFWLIAPPLGPGAAGLIVGAGLIGLIMIAGLIGLIFVKRRGRARNTAPHRGADNRIEDRVRPLIGDRATEWTKANTGLAIIGALSAGVLLGFSPGTRRLIYDATRPVIVHKTRQAIEGLLDHRH